MLNMERPPDESGGSATVAPSMFFIRTNIHEAFLWAFGGVPRPSALAPMASGHAFATVPVGAFVKAHGRMHTGRRGQAAEFGQLRAGWTHSFTPVPILNSSVIPALVDHLFLFPALVDQPFCSAGCQGTIATPL